MGARKVVNQKSLVYSYLLGSILLPLWGLWGCATNHSTEIARIALLAPFEGRYREIGYNAYYAAKLALTDSSEGNIELLALDDGGNVNSAIERAKALAQDPLVKVVIALGYAASNTETQQHLGNLPLMIVGDWEAAPEMKNVFILANAGLKQVISGRSDVNITDAASMKAPLVGGDVFALQQFPLLREDTGGVQIASSGALPDAAFRERYLQSGEFVPEPGLLATLTYDAMRMAIQAANSDNTGLALTSMAYTGINGTIRFSDGYWADAPIHYFCYESTVQQKASVLEACSGS